MVLNLDSWKIRKRRNTGQEEKDKKDKKTGQKGGDNTSAVVPFLPVQLFRGALLAFFLFLPSNPVLSSALITMGIFQLSQFAALVKCIAISTAHLRAALVPSHFLRPDIFVWASHHEDRPTSRIRCPTRGHLTQASYQLFF